jgi:hypothetical protein
MKVSNDQKPQSGSEGVSREDLNKWQREDAKKPKDKPSPDPGDEKTPPQGS